jgi:hypothetical protein
MFGTHVLDELFSANQVFIGSEPRPSVLASRGRRAIDFADFSQPCLTNIDDRLTPSRHTAEHPDGEVAQKSDPP